MRIHFINALGIGDADHFQQFQGAGLHLFFTPVLCVVKEKHFPDLFPDAKHRVQSRHGFLEDHGDHIAADALHDFIGGFGHVIGLIP